VAESADGISVVRPNWHAPNSVRVFNTTRLGGVSQAPFHSLNLGLHVHDDETDVRVNRRLLATAESVPAEPNWLQQVHGSKVVCFPQHGAQGGVTQTADAAFTDTKATVIAVLTADCLPVAFTNGEGTRVAVAHAGWKGLACGVLQRSLAKFDKDKTVHVWLGPAIGPNQFEVGQDVYDAFVSDDEKQSAHFTVHPFSEKKYFADLYGLARRIIQRNAANAKQSIHISGGDYCTYTDSERFHSYRRDGSKSGRMAMMAWLTS